MRLWTRLNWAIVAAILASPAQAVVFGNAQDSADFPQGISSFADRVASFSIGTDVDPQFTNGANALGPPDVSFANPFGFTSLGNGGVLILEFTDNFLTGSSMNGMADGIDDLFIFEVVVPESTFISVSADGTAGSFVDIGNLNPAGDGSVRNISIDIDAF